MHRKQIYSLIISILTYYSYGQKLNQNSSFTYSIEGKAFFSNEKSVFWHKSNQNGELPNYQQIAIQVKVAVQKRYFSDSLGKEKLIDWGAGSTGIILASHQSTALISQLYAQLKIWKIEISVGRRYEKVGIIDNNLASGNYSFSDNSLPIPKLQLSSTDFIEMPFTKKVLAFKFNYADGLIGLTKANPFQKSIFIKDTYLHQKSLYGRFGKPRWKLKLYGGFAHQVMWGGEYQIWPTDFNMTQKVRYWAVISGGTWLGSRVGNHVANLDLGLSYNFPTFDLMLYRQNLVEDGSLYRGLSNIADGLNGISIDFKQSPIRNITINSPVW